MSYILLPLNTGDGTGGQLIADQFTQGSDTATVVYSGLAFGTLGGGSYQAVDLSNGYPVHLVAGSVAQSGSWTVALGAGSALVGQFELSDGTNVLGTSSHPVIVSVNGNITLAGTSAVSIADGSDATFGAQADAAAADDTSTASFISLFKRNLEHLTSLIDQLPAALSGSGNLKVAIEEAVSTVTVSVSGTTTISGTVTANIGTTNGLALDATLTGGTAKAIARGGQKGTTNTNADITHTASGSNHEALDVAIYDASGNMLGTSGAPLRIDPTGTTTQTVSVSGTVTISGAVVGNVASGASDSGDPVKVGGVYNSSAPTFTTGQRGDLQLDSAGRLIVNVGAGGGSGSNAAAGATGSTVPTDADYQGLNVAGTLRGQTGVNPSGSIYAGQVDLASVAGTTIDTNSGNKSAGTLRVVLATDQPQLTNKLLVTADAITFSSAQAVTQSGTWGVGLNSGSNNAGYMTPAVGGGTVGATPFALVAAASNNLTTVQSSATTLWNVIAVNLATSVRYLKFFNGSPTMGTTNAVFQIPLPTAGTANGGGAAMSFPVGLSFASGLYIAITGGEALNDNTSVSANDVSLSLAYK